MLRRAAAALELPAPGGAACTASRARLAWFLATSTPSLSAPLPDTPMFVPQRQMLPSSAFFACSSVGFGFFSRSATGRHHEARRAEAAHQPVVVAERLLHRMQRVAVARGRRRCESFLPCASIASIEHE